MKIALIGTTASCVIGFRSEMIQALVARGHVVFAFAIDYCSESKLLVENMGAVPVDYKLNRAGLNPFIDLANTCALSATLRKLSLDLVFSYFSKPVIFGTLAAVFAGVPRRVGMLEGLGFVFTVGPNGDAFKHKVLRKIQVMLYRISFPFLDRIIFLNKDDPVDLLKNNNLKVKQVDVLGPIGLDLSAYPYVPPDKHKVSFIFVARLLAEKGVHEYIAAARLVKKSYPFVEFILLGGLDDSNPGGLKKDELDILIKEGVVIYPGHVNDVSVWLAKSSVFVLPSYYREGIPRSTQEAMAVGRVVITTDVPGCRETVIDGVNGFLVPPWDPEALANKMIIFIEKPELVESMGLESYQIARQKFDAHQVNQKLVSLLEF